MNLITIIVILLLVWVIYSILDSYNKLQIELKEIRTKCIIGGGNISQDPSAQLNSSGPSGPNGPYGPIQGVKNTLLNGLNGIMQKTY